MKMDRAKNVQNVGYGGGEERYRTRDEQSKISQFFSIFEAVLILVGFLSRGHGGRA